MSVNDLLSRVRHWDNTISKWLMNNFYYTFFHLVVVVVFLLWAVNMLGLITTSLEIKNENPLEKMMILQSFNSSIMTFLLLLNSLWILYLLNNSHRIKNSLKNISYNTAIKPFHRDRDRKRPDNRDRDNKS